MSSDTKEMTARPDRSSRIAERGNQVHRLLRVLAATILVAGVLVVGGAVAASGQSITLSQSTGLTNLQSVTVTGTGYDPTVNNGNVSIIECASQPAGTCDFATAGSAPIQPDGSFSTSFTVHQTFQFDPTGANILIDCTVTPGCSISAAQSSTIVAAQSISFGAVASQPSVTVTPNSGLSDSQQVNVTGQGYGSGSVFVFECQQGAPACDFSGGVQATADISGAFSLPFVVHSSFVGYDHPGGTGAPVDCTIGSGCQLVAAQSQTAFAAAPISFATQFDFAGFFSPVNNRPTVNVAKAGSSIPVKFSLGGAQGLDIFAAGYPKSEVMVCDSSAELDGIEATVTAGSSSLQYDPATGLYTYVWKTDKGWADTCRQLVLKLSDGSVHRANFELT